jgi:ATP-dependent DNA helicase RecQ
VARSESRIACGKNLIAQMLCGSNSAKIKKLRLNQLSTFGLLRQLKQAEVATLIDILIAIGCLEQEDIDRFRPVLKLTPLGGDVMRGKADLPAGLKLPGELRLKLRRPTAKDASRPKVAASAARLDHDVVHGDAAEETHLPLPQPSRRPQTVQPWGQAPSVADDEVSRRRVMSTDPLPVGDDEGPPLEDAWIIGSMVEDEVEGSPGDALETAESAPAEVSAAVPNPPRGTPTAVSSPRSKPTPAAVNRPSYYWTWRLLSQGFPADECLAIRGIARETLLDHVFQAAENGLEVRSTWCLSAETIAALDAVVGDDRPRQIRPLLAQLPPGTRYEEVQIYLKCRSS